MASLLIRLAVVASAATFLAGCDGESGNIPARAYAPIPGKTLTLMSEKNTTRSAPVLVRAYKKESEIELWKQNAEGRYVLLKSYPVCRWSGQLGPKKQEGDRQVPEGFYTVTTSQMNPNSAYWLAFNVGYPNPMERAMGRNGGDIMVHGTCSSRGCFAMTNEQIEEIYAVMREAFNGGQKAVQFQSYPFRMTAENLARFRNDPNIGYWKNLKEGNDHFEVTKQEPKVAYCGSRYVFNATAEAGRMDPTGACPKLKVDEEIASAVQAKDHADQEKVAEFVQRGTPAVRIRYADGGQHPSFRTAAASYADPETRMTPMTQAVAKSIGDVSRPEAVAMVEEFTVDERGQRKDTPPAVAAAAPAAAPAATVAAAPRPAAVAAVAPAPATVARQPASTGGALSAIGGLFGRSSAEPSTTTAQAVPSARPATDGAQPFYKRWLGLAPEDAAAAPAAVEPVPPAPANVPLPPKRQASAGQAKVALASGE
jgi:murein L,D-transpeptidase YafK